MSAYYGGREIQAPRGLKDGISGLKLSLLASVDKVRSSLLSSVLDHHLQWHEELLGSEWVDDTVVAQIIKINSRTFFKIPAKNISEENIGLQIRMYDESIEEIRDYVAGASWENIVIKNRRVMIQMSAEMLVDFDFDKLLRSDPSAALIFQKSQINDRVLRSIVRYCSLSDMNEAVFSCDNFLSVMEESGRSFIKEKGALNTVLSFLIEQSDGLISGNTLSFLNAQGERLLAGDRSIIDEIVKKGIERHRTFAREDLGLNQILFEAMADSRKAEIFASTPGNMKFMFGDEIHWDIKILARLFLYGKSLESVIVGVELTREIWMSLVKIYPRDVIFNHPEGRRFLLEHEMGL